MTTTEFGIGTVDREFALVAAGLQMPVTPSAPVASPVNLVRSSRIPPDETNGRWVNGFAYLPEGVGKLTMFDDCSNTEQTIADITPFVSDWQPYVLSAQFRCSTFGFDAADYMGRATRLLDAATPKMLEEEFWNGTLSQAASLANTWLEKAGSTAFTATSMRQAFAICEQALGDAAYGGRGSIHMPPYLVPYAAFEQLIRREGNLLLTDKDTIVVPGSGYGKMADAPAGLHVYATGITDVRLGDIIVTPDGGNMAQSIDKASNTVVVKAERYACASWDELLWVKVTVTLP
jgi:hypothetical protein